jgi:hypothetical protein
VRQLKEEKAAEVKERKNIEARLKDATMANQQRYEEIQGYSR